MERRQDHEAVTGGAAVGGELILRQNIDLVEAERDGTSVKNGGERLRSLSRFVLPSSSAEGKVSLRAEKTAFTQSFMAWGLLSDATYIFVG